MKRRLAPALLVVWLAACESPQTALVLEAQSEVPEGALDEVVFRVTGPGLEGGSKEAAVPLVGPDARSFPLTLVLVGSGAGGGPFAVDIEGRRSGAAQARAVPLDGDGSSSMVAFVAGKIARHRFVLRGPLATRGTPGPGPEPDAGAPPSMPPPSMPPPSMPPGGMCEAPAGCACGQLCRGRRCGCTGGCPCQFACEGNAKCEVDCSGAGTTCQVDVGPAKGADLKCHAGARCTVTAGEVKEEVRLECKGADCELTCAASGGGGCKLECKEGSRCLLRCADQTCKLDCPGGMLRQCPDGALACNREC